MFMPKQVVTIIKEGRRETGVKERLKESEDEERRRIQSEKRKRKERENKAAIKKLKKEGKVQPIAGFLFTKEEEEDPWMTAKLKKMKPANRKSNKLQRGSTSRSVLDDSDDDDDDDCIESLLSFKPFKSSR